MKCTHAHTLQIRESCLWKGAQNGKTTSECRKKHTLTEHEEEGEGRKKKIGKIKRLPQKKAYKFDCGTFPMG